MNFFKRTSVHKAIILVLFCLCLIISSKLQAARNEYIAEVVMLKGSATKLVPHSREATVLKMGDKLIEDTSILTEDRSFVRLKFRDGSAVSLGASSKIVLVEMSKNDVSLISLLKGKLRSKVEKESESTGANKFYIKTRSAAMGVRGTDFQTIYNPDNKLTSLVTFEGEVAMAKIDTKTHRELDQLDRNDVNVEVQRDVDGGVQLQKNTNDPFVQMQKIDKILNTKDAVVVEAGQYSGASDNLKKSSIPVKINPVQFEVLLKNQELNEKKTENLKSSTLIASSKTESLMVDSKASPEGFFDSKTGDFAPKSGGVVDLDTGLYVAPDASAKFDEKNKVYVSEKIGGVDKETGQYVAPVGLKLDGRRGFVEVAKTNDPTVLSLKEDLNNSAIQKDIVIGSPVENLFKLENKFLKEEMSLALVFGSLNKSVSGGGPGEFDKETDHYNEFRIKWAMSSALRFRPVLEFRYKSASFANDNRYIHSDESAFDLFTGMHYSYSERTDFLFHFGIRQDVYAQNNSDQTMYQFTRMGITELGVGVKYNYDFSEKLLVKTIFLPYYAFKRDVGNVGTKSTTGIKIEIVPNYNISQNKSIGFGLTMDSSKRSVTTTSAGTTNDKSVVSGLVLQYNVNL